MMLDTVLSILGVTLAVINTIVNVVDTLNRAKENHKKSNHPCYGESCFFYIYIVTIN